MENDPKNDAAALLNAEEVIRALGGIRPAAAKLNMPVTTVQGWKNRGRIPKNRQSLVETALAMHGVDVSAVSENSVWNSQLFESVPPSTEAIVGDGGKNSGDEPETIEAEEEVVASTVSSNTPTEVSAAAPGRAALALPQSFSLSVQLAVLFCSLSGQIFCPRKEIRTPSTRWSWPQRCRMSSIGKFQNPSRSWRPYPARTLRLRRN